MCVFSLSFYLASFRRNWSWRSRLRFSLWSPQFQRRRTRLPGPLWASGRAETTRKAPKETQEAFPKENKREKLTEGKKKKKKKKTNNNNNNNNNNQTNNKQQPQFKPYLVLKKIGISRREKKFKSDCFLLFFS